MTKEVDMVFASQNSIKHAPFCVKTCMFWRGVWMVLLACALCALLGGCASLPSTSSSGIGSLAANDVPATSHNTSDQRVENPIDFKALQEQNNEVYAWIYVPGTEVNSAVLQSSTDDNFYLTHDIRKDDSAVGAIYSQSVNSKRFADPVTLLYGHTFEAWQDDLKDEAFGTLHNFEDADFFANHEVFYIYLPDKVLTYKIVSAYEYDDRHIMNTFDFDDQEVLQQYFDYVASPDSKVKNVREGVTLTAGKNRIVQLSTCTRPDNFSARYLVTGVLVEEQQTATPAESDGSRSAKTQ